MIDIQQENFPDFPASLLENAARAALSVAEAPDADLTLVLTGEEEIRALNRDFLGHDRPTDVLSFPADELDPETGRRYLGDVVICLPRAAAQAAVRGHTTEAEVQLLAVHGVLHLLGYDHAAPEEKARMWEAQARALKSLGIEVNIVEE